ncbi:MAG: SDR family oxidoreductase [Bifidobacteriaceae bacterium]|nr:SDR family oxidoreductase [Bifidobacteriaceae bacterium]
MDLFAPPSLSGMIGIVTGGGQGIGRAITRALAGLGMTVAVLGRDQGRLDAELAGLAQEREAAGETGGKMVGIQADVTDKAAVTSALQEVMARFGRLDLLVNNAGLTPWDDVPVASTDPAEFQAIMDTNVWGLFLVTRLAMPYLTQHGGGQIINILSGGAHVSGGGDGAYCASKYAALALTEAMAAEQMGTGVRVHAVSPGPVDTRIWDPAHCAKPPSAADRAKMLKPEDVARAVVFCLAQPAGVYIPEVQIRPWS